MFFVRSPWFLTEILLSCPQVYYTYVKNYKHFELTDLIILEQQIVEI